MKRAVATWAGAGFLLAVAWAVYAANVPMYRGSIGPAMWTLLAVTFPAAFASMKIGFPLQLVWSLILNTATFAMIGAIIEGIRISTHRLHESHH